MKRLLIIIIILSLPCTGLIFAGNNGKPDLQITEAGGVSRFGKGYKKIIKGIPVIYLKGNPYEMGLQKAVLNEDIFLKGMRFFIDAGKFVTRDMPRIKRWFLTLVADWRINSIFQRYDESIRAEIQGLIFGMAGKIEKKEIIRASSAFDLTMNYACTTFAAKDSATKDGQLIIGRNFDFGGAGAFDIPFITVYQPDSGYRFASFGVPVWNLSGVTSFNEKGLLVIAHIAIVKDANLSYQPIGNMLRKIIQYCATIDEAVEIIKNTRRMCGVNLILAESNTGKAVVVEVSASDYAVREMENDVIWATNHFVSPKMKDKIVANHYLFDFQIRYARMRQLLEANHGQIDVAKAAGFLRDTFALNQNRQAVNNHTICATFKTDYPFSPNNDLSLVFEPGSFNFWFAKRGEPAAMGEFVGFNLLELFEGRESNVVPASVPASDTPEQPSYKRRLNNYKTLYNAQENYDNKNYVNAIIDLNKVIRIEPDHIDAHYYLAYTYFRSQKWELAKDYARKTLELEERLEIPPQFRKRSGLTFVLLGRIYQATNKNKEAAGYFDKAVRLSEKWPHANNIYAAKLAKKYRRKKFLGIF